MKVSDIVIEFLERKNVKHIFTVSGGGCIHLIDSLGKSEKLKYICTHHEQSVAMAAEGYSRLNNNIGACIVTTGPGGTNALTGVLGCWLDSIPCFFISGQVPLSQISEGTNCRQIGDQEFDIVKTVSTMTKYATIIKNKTDILYELEKAWHISQSDRPGPVWIDIPLDIQGADVDLEDLKEYKISDDSFSILKNNIEDFKKLLNSSKKPLIVTGNGIWLSKSYEIFDKFLKKNKIPVVTGIHSGIDCVDNDYEYYAGRVGILGQITSNRIIQECDLLIILGSRLSVKMTGYNLNGFSPNSKKIYVDIDINEINKHKFKIDHKINCDLKVFLNEIINIEFDLDIDEWRNYIVDLRKTQKFIHQKHIDCKDYLSFYYFIHKAGKYFEDFPIITSNGSAHVITLQTIKVNKNQRIFTNVGCASMGYGLPAAIGACFSNNSKTTICFEGDGSILMNLQDLQTLKTHNLPIKVFIINNDGYISIKITQESFFKGKQVASSRESGVEIPNFRKISDAFEIKYFSISSNDEIESKMPEIMEYNGPCIIELFTHPKEKHEPKVVAKGIDSNGKMIPGELTDMYISDSF